MSARELPNSWLIEILLPLTMRDGEPVSQDVVANLRQELTARFGGLTAFDRQPASGIWLHPDGEAEHDRLIVLEIMSESLDTAWWRAWRQRVQALLGQDELVVRAHAIKRL